MPSCFAIILVLAFTFLHPSDYPPKVGVPGLKRVLIRFLMLLASVVYLPLLYGLLVLDGTRRAEVTTPLFQGFSQDFPAVPTLPEESVK